MAWILSKKRIKNVVSSLVDKSRMFSSLHLVKNKKMWFFLHFFLPYLIDIFSDLPTTQTNKDYDPLFFNKLAMTNWATNIHYNPVSLLKARFGGGGVDRAEHS